MQSGAGMRAEAPRPGRALLLVAAVTALRWALLAFDRTDLFVDEAQYWLWGQEFAFGYYSKPPMIAWLIGSVTWLAGSDDPFWIRMPGAALHGATALILGAVAARGHGGRIGFLVAAAYVSLPMVGMGSLLISTDTVMAPFFAAALLYFARMAGEGRARDAALAGAMAGLAFLAKYAAVYFLIGAVLAVLITPGMPARWRNLAVLAGCFALVIAPNILWNLGHQMMTLQHTVDNAGWLRDGPARGLNLGGMAGFLASQFAVFGPVLFAMLLLALRRPRAHAGLLVFVLPALVVVSGQALLDKAYANWAIAAYFAGTILAVLLLEQRPRLRAASFAINGAICVVLPVLTLFPALGTGDKPLLARFLGREALSLQIMAEARAAGDVPVVADDRSVLADLFYTGRGSGLAFYAPRPHGRPANHYEATYPAPQGLTGRIIRVTATPPVCATGLQRLPLDLAAGAYARSGLAAYLMDAGCLNAAS